MRAEKVIRGGIHKYIYSLPVAISGIGFLIIMGWIFHIPTLVQLHPSFLVVNFNTALYLIVSGIGLFAWLHGHVLTMRVCAGVLIVVAVLTLTQTLFGWDLGIDELIIQHDIATRGDHPGRMGASTVLCLSLFGVALLSESFAASRTRFPYLSWCLSAIVLLVTFLSLTIDTRDVPYAYAWSEYTDMAVLTGIAFLLLSVAFITITYMRSEAEISFKLHRLAILGATVLGVALSLFYWHSLNHNGYLNALDRFQKQSEHYGHMLAKQLEFYRNSLHRQAQRLAHSPGYDASVNDLKSYVTDFPYLDQLQLSQLRAQRQAPSLNFTQPGVQSINTDWLTAPYIDSLVEGKEQGETVYEYRPPHIVFYIDTHNRQQGWLVAHINMDKMADEVIPETIMRRVTGLFTDQALYHVDKEGLLVLTQSIRIGNDPVALLAVQSSKQWFADFNNQAYLSVIVAGLIVTLLLGLLVNRNFRLGALHQSLSRLQDIVPLGLLAVDSSGNIVSANKFILNLLGYTEQELIGAPIESLVPPELTEHSKWRAGFVKVASSRPMGAGMLEIVHKNAERIPVEIALNVSHTTKGVVVMATIINASERARLLNELSDQKTHLENLLTSMGEGVWGLNTEGAISFVNPAACKMLGYENEDELLGESMHDKAHYKYPDGTDYPREQCEIRRSLSEGECHEVNDEVFWRKDGSSFPVEYVSTPVYNGTELVGVVVVFRDISQRLRMDALEEEYKHNLERVNQELKEFSYVASHDLQEPLRTLKGYCEILEEDVQSNDQQGIAKDIGVITKAAERMQQLIKDLLEYSRSGKTTIDLTPIDLNDCLSMAADNLEQLIKSTGTKVTLGKLPRVLGDTTMLTRILQNLIHNAIKFHSDAAPEVRITLVDDSNDKPTICIEDNGIGVDAKYHDDIFNAFKRLHRMDEYEGSGIGLAIVRKIIEKHQGRIWLESSPGKGCKFYITLLGAGSSPKASAVSVIY